MAPAFCFLIGNGRLLLLEVQKPFLPVDCGWLVPSLIGTRSWTPSASSRETSCRRHDCWASARPPSTANSRNTASQIPSGKPEECPCFPDHASQIARSFNPGECSFRTSCRGVGLRTCLRQMPLISEPWKQLPSGSVHPRCRFRRQLRATNEASHDHEL